MQLTHKNYRVTIPSLSDDQVVPGSNVIGVESSGDKYFITLYDNCVQLSPGTSKVKRFKKDFEAVIYIKKLGVGKEKTMMDPNGNDVFIVKRLF